MRIFPHNYNILKMSSSIDNKQIVENQMQERNDIKINDKFSYTLCSNVTERQYILKVIEINPKSYILQQEEVIDTPKIEGLDYDKIKTYKYKETAYYNKEYDGLYIRGICGGDYKNKTYLKYYY